MDVGMEFIPTVKRQPSATNLRGPTDKFRGGSASWSIVSPKRVLTVRVCS
jgi:hypothetical protein